MTSSAALSNLDLIVQRAAQELYTYGDGRSSTAGPTALFAARDLRYAPIIRAGIVASTVPELDDTELDALIQAGHDAGYFAAADDGFVVTFAGHKRARVLQYEAGEAIPLFFINLAAHGLSLAEAILLLVSDGTGRNYPFWLGELEVTFSNAGRAELETAIRTLRADGLLKGEADLVNLESGPFHIDDALLTPIPTINGNREAARLRKRPEIAKLLRRQSLLNDPGVRSWHGRSHDWRALADFIEKKLGYEVVEFATAPTAGTTIVARLEQMLNEAGFAFIVATAEDEQIDGKLRARENVVHEIGLFQGRLGFERAIVFLEEGCNEFSNIHGLIELRFRNSEITAQFEQVRELLGSRLPK